ncbi:MAG: SGNH/GDSL hydrolase family protein [Candidatus Aureabacteria bacterium]|nr:SGNH/GDSL hydrolase family protein [Candidatus Auribacterota bacterium]
MKFQQGRSGKIKKVKSSVKKKYQFTGDYDIFDPIFPDQMKYVKEKNDFRIFCMGGSTTQGYPYFINGSFPAFLEGMLRIRCKEKDVEVVNLGVTAMNSYGVLDFMKMVPEYQPDLIVIYMGHNEFFGAMGSASNLFWGTNRVAVRFFLKLQEFKVYLLARDVFYKIKGYFKKPRPLTSTLMREIVRVKEIPVRSPLRPLTMENFKQNLEDILLSAKKNNIPVLISTVVCNLKPIFYTFSRFQKKRSLKRKGLQKSIDKILLNVVPRN